MFFFPLLCHAICRSTIKYTLVTESTRSPMQLLRHTRRQTQPQVQSRQTQPQVQSCRQSRSRSRRILITNEAFSDATYSAGSIFEAWCILLLPFALRFPLRHFGGLGAQRNRGTESIQTDGNFRRCFVWAHDAKMQCNFAYLNSFIFGPHSAFYVQPWVLGPEFCDPESSDVHWKHMSLTIFWYCVQIIFWLHVREAQTMWFWNGVF